MTMKISLFNLLESYEKEQHQYISELEAKIVELEERNQQYLALAVKGAQVREKATLELILAGALRKPDKLCFFDDCPQDYAVTEQLGKVTCPSCRAEMNLNAEDPQRKVK